MSANENGCADALPALGVLYLRSDDEKKKEKGFGYVRFAAEHGDDTCLHLLGFCYMTGTGVARDEEKAVEAWENAVERGVVNAMVDLGKYYSDRCDDAGLKRAMELYARAEENGSAYGAYDLGWVYVHRLRDAVNALPHFERAVELGAYDAYWDIASLYYGGELIPQDLEKAFGYYSLGAERGDADCIAALGIMYYYGQGTAEDRKKAVEHFKKGALLGNASAMINLAKCHLTGEGVRKSVKKAVELYTEAAKESAEAAYDLALMYMSGDGVEKDAATAIGWLGKAADGGNTDAMFDLAELYDRGEQVPKDDALAFRYYKLAGGTGGDANAMFNVGLCYFNGRATKRTTPPRRTVSSRRARGAWEWPRCNWATCITKARAWSATRQRASSCSAARRNRGARRATTTWRWRIATADIFRKIPTRPANSTKKPPKTAFTRRITTSD